MKVTSNDQTKYYQEGSPSSSMQFIIIYYYYCNHCRRHYKQGLLQQYLHLSQVLGGRLEKTRKLKQPKTTQRRRTEYRRLSSVSCDRMDGSNANKLTPVPRLQRMSKRRLSIVSVQSTESGHGPSHQCDIKEHQRRRPLLLCMCAVYAAGHTASV